MSITTPSLHELHDRIGSMIDQVGQSAKGAGRERAIKQVLDYLKDAPDCEINRKDMIYFCEHLLALSDSGSSK